MACRNGFVGGEQQPASSYKEVAKKMESGSVVHGVRTRDNWKKEVQAGFKKKLFNREESPAVEQAQGGCAVTILGDFLESTPLSNLFSSYS